MGRGLHDAGFDVLGVDIEPQPDYPFDFLQADALEMPTAGFDFVHASPPCPRYSLVSGFQGVAENHPDLIVPVRAKLDACGLPYSIENVPNSPLRRDLVLCGDYFGLRVIRHRIFELSGFSAMQPPHPKHRLRGARTNCEKGPGIARWLTGNYADHEDAKEAMGIDWNISRRGLANAVPPAYGRYVGTYAMAAVRSEEELVHAA